MNETRAPPQKNYYKLLKKTVENPPMTRELRLKAGSAAGVGKLRSA